MEAFKLLSRGGVRFDKRRFNSDLEIFQVCVVLRKFIILLRILRSTQPTNRATAKTEKGKEKGDQLPPELDFFKYAQGGATKRKAVELESNDGSGKEKRNRGRSSSDVEYAEDAKEEGPSIPRHRVTSKGSNVPDPAMSFKDLQERYDIPSRIMQNLDEYGYKSPTAIQMHAAPILLEVRVNGHTTKPWLTVFRIGSRFSCNFPDWHWKDALVSRTSYVCT